MKIYNDLNIFLQRESVIFFSKLTSVCFRYFFLLQKVLVESRPVQSKDLWWSIYVLLAKKN